MRQHEFTRDRHLLFCVPCIKTSEPYRSADGDPMTLGEFTTDPVPLYLIPQALSAEIHRFGDAIAEVHIRRTVGHNYVLNVHHDQEDPDAR